MAGSKISCMGIIGDGCGGGREFIVDGQKLLAYDSFTNETITLLENIKNAINISKKSCIITITCRDTIINFDLSKINKEKND